MFGERWFAVVPDSMAAAFAAKMLRRYAAKVITHSSGRPWLLGNWPDGQLATFDAGPARLALAGRYPCDLSGITARLRRVRDIAEIDRAVAGVPGSFHVLASIGGRVRVRGSASGARRICHARVAGVTVAASRADVLAALAGAGIDDQVLALRLMIPAFPYPLEERTVWQGVRGVPPDECLLVEADGSARTSGWWRPPPAVLSLEEAAVALREALVGSVATCTVRRGTVGAELSGDLATAAVCFLAASGPARLVTARSRGADPGDGGERWAEHAAAALPGVEHVAVEPTGRAPWLAGFGDGVEAGLGSGFGSGIGAGLASGLGSGFGGGLAAGFGDSGGLGGALGGGNGGSGLLTDEPCAWAGDQAGLIDIAGRMVRIGARLHIGPGGSGELLVPPPPYLYDLLRRHPMSALRRMRRYRAERRLTWRALLRSLGDRRSYGEWLEAVANRLDRDPAAYAEQCMSWQPDPRTPPWASTDAVWAAASLLRQAAADEPGPLSPDRAPHLTLQCVRARGAVVHQMDQLLAGLGIGYAAPYSDDAVVEAVLSLRPRERLRAGARATPLLAEAMRGIVPGHILRRTSGDAWRHAITHADPRRPIGAPRGDRGELREDCRSLREHRRELLGLFADSLLARRGLIDPDRVRATLFPSSDPAHLDSLPPTLGCEIWLRSLPSAGGATRTAPAVPVAGEVSGGDVSHAADFG